MVLEKHPEDKQTHRRQENDKTTKALCINKAAKTSLAISEVLISYLSGNTWMRTSTLQHQQPQKKFVTGMKYSES